MGCGKPEIARNLGADRYTFNEWMTLYPEFANAVDEGKMLAQFDVVEALFKRCVGFKVRTTMTYKDGSTAVKEEYVVPDVQAIKYWLENRCDKHWKPSIVIAEAAPAQGAELNARVIEYPRKDPEAVDVPMISGPVTVPPRDVASPQSS